MIRESEYCSKTTKIEFDKPLLVSEKDLNNSTKCQLCKNAYEER